MDKADRIIKINESIAKIQQLDEIAPLITAALGMAKTGLGALGTKIGAPVLKAYTSVGRSMGLRTGDMTQMALSGMQRGQSMPTSGAPQEQDTISAPHSGMDPNDPNDPANKPGANRGTGI
jgi:hypothetical protein